MKRQDYAKLTAVKIASLVAARAVPAAEIAEVAFDAVAAAEPRIHAFAAVDRDGALAQARLLDAKLARGETGGALAGVPVVIKDLVLTKGLRTTFGSRLYADYVPEDDDIVVERLRAAGAIILGKTNTSEFGFGAHGRNLLFEVTRNPWDLSRTPGGSSAGSAAAVAAGVCPLSIGSDGGGSIRIPAAFSGLFGMKASMGRVPLWPGCRDERLPGASGWESIEHVGPITRTVADAALMLSAIAGPDPRDRLSSPSGDIDWVKAAEAPLPEGLRLTYWPEWPGHLIDPEVRAAVDRAVGAFAKAYKLHVEIGEPPPNRHRSRVPDDHRAGDGLERHARACSRQGRAGHAGRARLARTEAAARGGDRRNHHAQGLRQRDGAANGARRHPVDADPSLDRLFPPSARRPTQSTGLRSALTIGARSPSHSTSPASRRRASLAASLAACRSGCKSSGRTSATRRCCGRRRRSNGCAPSRPRRLTFERQSSRSIAGSNIANAPRANRNADALLQYRPRADDGPDRRRPAERQRSFFPVFASPRSASTRVRSANSTSARCLRRRSFWPTPRST